MFKIEELTEIGRYKWVKNFNMEISKPEIHVLLSPSVNFLDVLQSILSKTVAIESGKITFDGVNFYDPKVQKKIQYLSDLDLLYNDLTIFENIVYLGGKIGFYNSKTVKKTLADLADDTGFYLDANERVVDLTNERRKIVETLKCYHSEPKLLIVRDAANLFSHGNFSIFLNILEKMKRKGTTVLYLTSQWEEAIKVADNVTLVAHGENYGVFPVEEIRKDPSKIYSIMIGGHTLEENNDEKHRSIEAFKALRESVSSLPSGYNIERTLQTFAQYLVKELKASSCVMHMIDRESSGIIDIVAQQANEKAYNEITKLTPEMVKYAIFKEELLYFTVTDQDFNDLFVSAPNIKTVLVNPIQIAGGDFIIIQINFDQVYVYTEHDTSVLNWVASEMSIVIENSRLMNRSVLLQESYHRIKNNLQIIISLIEMEKDSLPGRVSDERDAAMVSDALDGVIGRIKSISQIHNLLAQENVVNKIIDVYTIVNEICKFYSNTADISIDFEEILIPYSKAVSIAMVFNEIITNSIKHNRGRRVKISIAGYDDFDNNCVHIICKDNGCGLSESGQKAIVKGEGVGMMVLNSIIRFELMGEFNMYNDNGARVDITIPSKALLPTNPRK